MSYGTPLSITLPTIDGVATEAQAATRINDCFTAIKSRLEGKVAPANMDINADLSFLSGATNYGAKDLQRTSWAALSAALSAATYPRSCYALNGDLYYNDESGNQVRLTASGAVNVAGVGGVTGSGYGTGGVEVNWDSVNTRYRMRSGSATDDFAAVECDDVLLRDASGNAIRLGAPAGMSADYTALLPGAVPASHSVLVMETGGTISHSTAPANLALASGGHFTVSGAGRYKHGTFVLLLPAASAYPDDNTHTATYSAVNGRWSVSGTDCTISYPLPLIVGQRLLTVSLHCSFSTADTKSLHLRKLASNGTVTTIQTLTSTSSSGWASRTFNFSDVTFATGETYYLVFEPGASSDLVGGVEVSYDLP